MSADTFRYASALGELSYRWDGKACLAVSLLDCRVELPESDDPVSRWLDAYFAGEPATLPPLAEARSPFQARMRHGLLHIPPGETRTYGELARSLHTSPRAMGQALGANPLPVLVPCHRVVAAHGLGGFSCGLAWKSRLLVFEAKHGVPAR